MCGIAGVVKLAPDGVADEATLKRMRDVIRHRGPDGEGLWIEGPVGLGHRRLAIVDVVSGQQPMTNEDGTCWIVYNGEIYNHAALRVRLEALGHRYQTRSDTETILHLYEEEGERCVEQLEGMFAFALWDRRRRRLLLARDRLGIKPLYYALTDRELLFGSEIKAILAGGALRPALERAVLPEYLATRFVSGEETFFRGIRKLLPGRTLCWSPEEGVQQRRYWRVPTAVDESGAGLGARAAEVRARLTEAVRSHLMSDVPLGLFLSGGIDSSALAALMAPMAEGPIRTFSVGFTEPEANELPYARLAARAVGAEHREVVISPAQYFQALPRLVWHEDEPMAFVASVPLYFVSQLARDHVKVVLTGEGSDELFLGYSRYRLATWNERAGRLYWSASPAAFRRGVRGALGSLPRPLRRYAGRTFLSLEPGDRALLESLAAFPLELQADLLANPELLAARDAHAEIARHCAESHRSAGERLGHADLHTYLVELLMKQDQMSMAASIESRVPFLDHKLVEHVSAIPGRFKIHGFRTKAVLRAAVRDIVPRPILTRRKMGFPVPLGRWLRGGFWPIVEALLLSPRALERGLFAPAALRRLAHDHRRGTADQSERLWLLLTLEIWQRVFLDGEDPDSLVSTALRAIPAASVPGLDPSPGAAPG